MISGTIAPGSANTYHVTIVAENGTSAAEIAFNWTVLSSVSIVNPGDQFDDEGDNVALALPVTGGFALPLTYSASNLPPGLSIDPNTGVISGMIAADSANTYAISVVAQDGNSSDEVDFNWTVLAPHITIANPGDQLNEDGDNIELAMQATTPFGLPLTYSAVNLPEGLSIDPDTGVISGIIAEGAAADYPFNNTTVFADDGIDSSAVSFSWFLVSTVDLANPGNQATTEGADVNLALQATSTLGPPFYYFASNLPPGLSVDPDTGVISGTIAAGAAANSPYAVTVFAEDNADVWLVSFSWLVTSAGSVSTVDLANPDDQTATPGSDVNLALQATSTLGQPISYSAINLPPGLSIDPAAGVISGTIATELGGDYPVTVTANDGTDSSTISFSWLVTTTVALSNPGDQTTTDGSDVNLALQATSALGQPVSYLAHDLPPGLASTRSPA